MNQNDKELIFAVKGGERIVRVKTSLEKCY